jgi:uncharacterized protein YgbK (DUF1537 family)
MPVETSDLERLLEHTLGFQREETHHHYFKLWVNGRLVVATKTSHSPKFRTIDDSLLAKIARQDLRISPAFLRDLLAGRKGRDDYLADLKAKGLL